MAHQTVEGRSAARRSRPSEEVASTADVFHIAHRDLAVHRITRRLGCGIEVAAVVAQLAGLGPRDGAR